MNLSLFICLYVCKTNEFQEAFNNFTKEIFFDFIKKFGKKNFGTVYFEPFGTTRNCTVWCSNIRILGIKIILRTVLYL